MNAGDCRKSYHRVSTYLFNQNLVVMKKIITFFKAGTLLLSLLFAVNTKAQDKLGCKVVMNDLITPFVALTDGTRVNDVETDCGTKSNIPIGFTYRFGACGNNTPYTTCQISSKGWIKFGTPLSNCAQNPATATVFPGLWPFYEEFLDGSAGTVTYLTETLPTGNKTFTVEWKNFRWKDLAAAGSDYFGISFQAKLYEGSNMFEYSYRRDASTSISTSPKPFQVGAGVDRDPKSAPYPVAPCPGWNFFQMSDPVTTPVVDRSGSFGAGLKDRPTDNQVLQFYTPCCGKPSAGVISQPDSVCPCIPFVAKLSGASPAPFTGYGVTYQWQTSVDGVTPASWIDMGVPGSATTQYFAGICSNTDTFIRVIVSCNGSGQRDTTPVKHISLIKLPYNCYCSSGSTNDDRLNMVNIGNVKLITKGNDTLINNPISGGTPAFVNKTAFRNYSLYTGLKPIREINRDSTYKFGVMGITKDDLAFSSSGVALYIDYNADGVYTAATELAAFQVISGTTTNFMTNFMVPSTAKLDTVGMRVVMKKGATTATAVPPCGNFTEGETEDYLLIISNPKCSGPLSAGTAYISDTSICDGYATMVWDTAHGRNMSGMNWEWEYSLDNVLWATVPASKFLDTIEPVIRQSTYFRMRTVCEVTNDTIRSNKVFIKLKKPYKCYCYSLANGQESDSSDISTVKLHTFTANSGGPHLNNPLSVRKRTDRTDLPAIELATDTKYPIAVYHTLRTKTHADARISVFIDYNHNLQYDVPEELVWTAVTTATDFYPHDSIKIPTTVIPDVETGMRVVLNNDLGINDPSDAGCEEFVSGEIEDYLVIFRKKSNSIEAVSNRDNLQIYPNPNNGQFTVSFSISRTINEASVTVTNVTGQEVYSEHYTGISNSFTKNINLGGQPSGVYFITLTTDGQKSINKLIVR